VGLRDGVTLVVLAALGCAPPGAPWDGGTEPTDAFHGLDARASGTEHPDGLSPSAEPEAGAEAGDDAGPGRSRVEQALELLASSVDVAAVDGFLHDVAWREGWPLHEGTRWLFVTRWDEAPERVSLVGHINGWSPTAHPAIRARTGVHFYVLLDDSELAVPPEGAKYKWWAEPDVWRAPPEATAYGYDEYGEFGWVRPPRTAPHLERFPDLRSAFLEAPRTVRAWLPAGFEPGSSAAAHARTLLLHDGQNVFGPAAPFGGWQVDRTLEREGYRDVLAIAVDHAPDRMDAYTPVSDRLGGRTVGGRASDYLRLLTEEVLPFARRRWGVVAEGRSLVIAGSSLGGLVSLWIASEAPSLAGCVAALSPTVGWGSIGNLGGAQTLIARWRGHLPVAIYLDSGGGPGTTGCIDSDGDGIRDDGDGRDNYCETLQMRDVLLSAGYVEGIDLHYRVELGAPHDESAWRARFPFALAACARSAWFSP